LTINEPWGADAEANPAASDSYLLAVGETGTDSNLAGNTVHLTANPNASQFLTFGPLSRIAGG